MKLKDEIEDRMCRKCPDSPVGCDKGTCYVIRMIPEILSLIESKFAGIQLHKECPDCKEEREKKLYGRNINCACRGWGIIPTTFREIEEE